MITSNRELLHDNATIAGNGNTAYSSVLDMGTAAACGALAEPPNQHYVVQIGTAMTTGTSTTFTVQGSADNSSYDDLDEAIPVLTAALTANTFIIDRQLPVPDADHRYLRVKYVNSGNQVAGTATIWIATEAGTGNDDSSGADGGGGVNSDTGISR